MGSLQGISPDDDESRDVPIGGEELDDERYREEPEAEAEKEAEPERRESDEKEESAEARAVRFKRSPSAPTKKEWEAHQKTPFRIGRGASTASPDEQWMTRTQLEETSPRTKVRR